MVVRRRSGGGPAVTPRCPGGGSRTDRRQCPGPASSSTAASTSSAPTTPARSTARRLRRPVGRREAAGSPGDIPSPPAPLAPPAPPVSPVPGILTLSTVMSGAGATAGRRIIGTGRTGVFGALRPTASRPRPPPPAPALRCRTITQWRNGHFRATGDRHPLNGLTPSTRLKSGQGKAAQVTAFRGVLRSGGPRHRCPSLLGGGDGHRFLPCDAAGPAGGLGARAQRMVKWTACSRNGMSSHGLGCATSASITMRKPSSP